MRKPRWTIRTWLIVPTAAIVTILSAAGALLQMDTLVRAWLASTRQLSELAARQVAEYIMLRLEDVDTESIPAGQPRRPPREFLLTFIDNDPKLGGLLESSAAGANSIAEISVADAAGTVLASSNRARPGNRSAQAQTLASLEELDALSRVRGVWTPGREYELRVPVGLKGDSTPLFVVQVLVSNALLRETLSPGFNRILGSVALAYFVALVLVCVVAEVTRRNLRRLGQFIDRIGEDPGNAITPGTSDRALLRRAATAEFDVVQSKLALMEGRVRGALSEAEDYRQRVGALLKGLEEAIVLLEGERVVLAAGAIEHLLGLPPDTLSGREFRELFSPDAPLVKLLRSDRGSRRPVHNLETELTVGDHHRRLVANVDYITDAADPNRTLTLLRLRDAEGATEVESQLQVVNRLEAINRLTGGVAHEIKNPLNAIAARLALLEAIVEGDSEAEGEIRVVADEIQRLDRVVRTFLDFTQPLEVTRDVIDLAELSRSVAEVVRPDAINRGVALLFSDESEGRALARGDRDLLQQAVMNIVINAVEAAPLGGEVRVVTSGNDRQCQVRVSDTGPGVPDSVRAKMFQLYFTTKTGGSGIGLAVAYRSLQLHGGDIRVDSEIGKGTTFELQLPALQREAVAIV
jgi:signal transduction histidine kinase